MFLFELFEQSRPRSDSIGINGRPWPRQIGLDFRVAGKRLRVPHPAGSPAGHHMVPQSLALRSGHVGKLSINRFHWLDERVERAQRIGRELDLPITWTPKAPATASELAQCERELQRIAVPFPPSLRDFLCLTNGASLVYRYVEPDGTRYGNTITMFS